MTRKITISTHRGQFLSIIPSVERSTLRISQNRHTSHGSRKKRKFQLLRSSIVTLTLAPKASLQVRSSTLRSPLFSSLRLWWPFWLMSHTSSCVFLAETLSQITSCWTSMVSHGLLPSFLGPQCSMGYGKPMRDGGVDLRCLGKHLYYSSPDSGLCHFLGNAVSW